MATDVEGTLQRTAESSQAVVEDVSAIDGFQLGDRRSPRFVALLLAGATAALCAIAMHRWEPIPRLRATDEATADGARAWSRRGPPLA